jgi:hypothetical protein
VEEAMSTGLTESQYLALAQSQRSLATHFKVNGDHVQAAACYLTAAEAYAQTDNLALAGLMISRRTLELAEARPVHPVNVTALVD